MDDLIVTEYRVAWLTRRHHPSVANPGYIESHEDFATLDDAELHAAVVASRANFVEAHVYPIRVYLTPPAATERAAA
ncbi:MAG: hypothetical protein HOV66_19760 [Streptomycetaceae bacterium]|nr:hypothetical protein [Streptomycetaceae bacterium]